jgi:outer membrane lipoprotein-sorting protein
LDEVTLDIDAQFRIVGIEILDPEGNRSQFVFTNLRENPDLPDRLFHFSIPKGVEVIQG